MGRLIEFCSAVDEVITEKGCTIPCRITIEDIRQSYHQVFKPTAEKISKNIFYILYTSAIRGGGIFLGSSRDIGDGTAPGEYEYYFGIDRDDDMMVTGYIYMYSHHSKTYPNQVMFYTEKYQIRLIQHDENVLVNPFNSNMYNMMMNFTDDTRYNKIIEYLKKT